MGAAIGEVLLGKKLGNRALTWGALVGSLPDIDVILAPFLDTARELAVHRGITHSFLLLATIPFLVAPWLVKLWKRDKISRSRATAFVFTALAVHILMDCLTTYGTKVFSPFSDDPVSFNTLFIIDPFLSGVFIVSVVWVALLKKKNPRRFKVAGWALAIASLYIGLACAAKAWVSHGFNTDLGTRQVKMVRRMEAPTAFNILLWRSVADRGDELWIGYKSVFERPSTTVRWVVIPKRREVLDRFAKEREIVTIDRFSRNWSISRPTAKGAWIADLRFSEVRAWERKATVDLRPGFAWEFSQRDPRDRLRMISPRKDNAGENLKRMARRIVGNRDGWEGIPRLTGNPGSLPESLEWRD